MTPSKAQVSQSIIGANLPAAASQILIQNISPETIAGGLGVSAGDLDTEAVTLFLLILDMTGSMLKNKAAVLKAYREMVEALKASKKANTILVSAWVFNATVGGKLLYSYLPLDLVPDLTGYDPDDQTNLYDTVLDGVTSLLQYEQDLMKGGILVQSVVVTFTDGEDNYSRSKATDVATVVKSLLDKEKYVISLVGFGPYTDQDPDYERLNKEFVEAIALRMGIPLTNVLSTGSTAHDIRIAVGTVSKSVIRASQTVIGKGSQTGFFNT